MFKIAVIDDEDAHREYFARRLEYYLANVPYTADFYTSPSHFLMEEKNADQLDLALVDVQFENENGIDFARGLKQTYPYVDIIFMSSHLDYAPKVYDVEHISFIYKRDTNHNLRQALVTALGRKSERNRRFLQLRWKNTYYRIPAGDILFIEKVLRKSNVHTRQRTYSTYMRLDDILKVLHDNVIRVHFSYAVNPDYVAEYHSDNIVLTNGQCVPVSRTYSKQVMSFIQTVFKEQTGDAKSGVVASEAQEDVDGPIYIDPKEAESLNSVSFDLNDMPQDICYDTEKADH